MINRKLIDSLDKIISAANQVVVIQADNPDGDSLASALALEEILEDQSKQVHLYCGVDIPNYLRHIKGWDRVQKDMPTNFDASIIVDTSAQVLLEKLETSQYRNWVAAKPTIVLDHHADTVCDIDYADLVINHQTAVSTGELIYGLARQLNWPLNLQAKTHIMSSILADSLGLSSEGTTPDTYRVMAELSEAGVDRPSLEEARRLLNKMPLSIYRYKAQLIDRTEFFADDSLALVTIPQSEITEYSPLYNPAPLVQNDMLQVENVKTAIVLKIYQDGKITAAIRSNPGANIAAELARNFGGGGHPYAAGFKITDGQDPVQVKNRCIEIATKLLDRQPQET